MKDIVKATEVTFEKQLGGYDRMQVDNYIKMLSDAYKTAYKEYTAVNNKYHDLLRDYEALKQRQQAPNHLIASAQAEAKRLVSEAEGIKAAAINEARQLYGDACIGQASAKRNVEAANAYLTDTICKLQSLKGGNAV